MGPLLVVLLQPAIQVGLPFLQCPIDFLPERHAIELIEHGLLESFTDSVRLRMPGLRPCVIDILDGQVQFIHMRSGAPQYSVPRSVSTRFNGIPCSSKNGNTQSFKRSAAVTG